VTLGLAIARNGSCVTSTDAASRIQRDGFAATWWMYRGYGPVSTAGGDRARAVRDGVRGVVYLFALALLTRPLGRSLAATGAVAYLSFSVVPAIRVRAGIPLIALMSVALAVKDPGNVAGALHGQGRRARRTR
jgi:hypothetical protein